MQVSVRQKERDKDRERESVCVYCSMAEKVMPSAYCYFPLSILFLLSLAFICCCCLLSYGLSVAQRLSSAVVQRCSAGNYFLWLLLLPVHLLLLLFLLLSWPLLQFSYSNRKEMSKNDKVNGCAQNTVHTDERTHTHTKSTRHRLGLCRAVAHLMALGPMPLDRIYVRKVQNFTCIWFMLALNPHATAATPPPPPLRPVSVCVCMHGLCSIVLLAWHTHSYIFQHFSEQMSLQCPGK